MRSWEEEYADPTTEPYTVLHIRNVGAVRWKLVTTETDMRKGLWLDEMMIRVPPGLFNFHVFYRNYSKRAWFSVEGRDELEAFMVATKRLAKSKAASDRRRAKLP